MEVRCSICGARYQLTKIHKDYQRLAADPQVVFICRNCENKVRVQASETKKQTKPI